MDIRVLVVDDEKIIAKGIRFSLEQDGMLVQCAYDGEEALNLIREETYDIVLLDVMLPKLNGFEVCQKVREFSDIPIIMLTAKGDDEDKIEGLECGADDYVTKPFNVNELKARIKAILRRSLKENDKSANATDDNIIEIRDMRLEIDNRRLFINNEEVRVTIKEFEVLLLLACNPGKVYSREKLLELVWGNDYPGDVRTVDVHIRRLRERIEPIPSYPKYVMTKWGVGYFFKD